MTQESFNVICVEDSGMTSYRKRYFKDLASAREFIANFVNGDFFSVFFVVHHYTYDDKGLEVEHIKLETIHKTPRE